MVYWGLVCGDGGDDNPYSCPYQKEDKPVTDRDTRGRVGRAPKVCVPVSRVFLGLGFQWDRRQGWTLGWSLQWPQRAPCSPAPLGRFSKAGPPSMQMAFKLSRLGREKSARRGPWALSSCERTTWDQWALFGIELSVWVFGAIPKGSPSVCMGILFTTIRSTTIIFLFVPKLEPFNISHKKGRSMVILLILWLWRVRSQVQPFHWQREKPKLRDGAWLALEHTGRL